MQRSAVRPSPIFLALLAVTVGGACLTLIDDVTAWHAGIFILVAGGWAVSLCLHEFGHAVVAYRGGDREIYFKGYLNLDIRRYTDPVLSLVLPLVFLAIGGIPLPGGAVWINRYALRSRAVTCRVSLAGPFANLVVGILLTIAVTAFLPPVSNAGPLTSGQAVACGLSFLAMLQFAAFVLNILPVPGLDGWGAIEPYLSREAQEFGAKARMWAPLILFALLFAVPGVNELFWRPITALFEAVGGDSWGAAWGRVLFMFWK
ncbi:site-2 protease family protein [Actinokineospora enzanensis]|uniref:site-2 protease family protein n=1 Tax=Actinokineospora enzanensis TaxID=155975 RepID=UPI0003706BBA|nr:site-2 protease family protein [Actinokineospora enzanensis]